jgi:hypothetical protein
MFEEPLVAAQPSAHRSCRENKGPGARFTPADPAEPTPNLPNLDEDRV